MKVYRASFIKKNGDEREMLFAKLKDLPESFVASKIIGDNKSRNYEEGQELVWDLEQQNFRVFNYNTLSSDIKEFNVNFEG